MRTTYDAEADAMYLYLNERPVKRTLQAAPSVILDLDTAGDVCGIEILFASRVFQGEDLSLVHLELPGMDAADVRLQELAVSHGG